MLKNKRAQFFIIFAVVIGVLMLVAASQLNQANEKQGIEVFKIKCQNYKNEIFKISEYALANNQKDNEFSFLRDFSNSFFSYMNQSHDFEMFYLYGNASNVIVANYMNQDINANNEDGRYISINSGDTSSISGSNVEINDSNGLIKSYAFSKDTSFYFYMQASKDKEVYVCE
jgi:hypothetical protein